MQHTQTNPLLLSIVVVSYNTAELTLQCLRSIDREVESSKLLSNSTELIVIDNRSPDNSVEKITAFKKSAHTKVIIHPSTKNLGFGAANNWGIEHSSGNYILFLNPDTELQAGALDKLVTAFLEDQEVDKNTSESKLGILAATLLNLDGTVQAQGGDEPSLLSLFCQMTLLDDLPVIGRFLPSIQHTGKRARVTNSSNQATQLTSIDWVAGTAMVVRRQVFTDCGMFDPQIFMYGEDVELCIRAKHHGWQIALHPAARVTHLAHQSTSSQTAIKGEFTGLQYIWAKHMPLWQVTPAKILLQLGALIRTIIFTILPGKANQAKVYSQILNQLLDQ